MNHISPEELRCFPHLYPLQLHFDTKEALTYNIAAIRRFRG